MTCTEKIQTGVALVAEGLSEIIENLARAINTAFSNLRISVTDWNVFVETYPNRKVVHLAFNASKNRVRKKNMARLLRDYYKHNK